MTTGATTKDLIILVADRNMEYAIRSLIDRPDSMGIRPVTFDLYSHPHHDPGCRLRGHDFLKPFTTQYARALMVFDREGCGREEQDRKRIEEEAESLLQESGWDTRAAVVVIDPELEMWVWSDSPVLPEVLGWSGKRQEDVKRWLEENGFLTGDAVKPHHPKEALEALLRETRKPRSSSLYGKLAHRVDFEGCVDSAFQKLRRVLTDWFRLSVDL